MQLADSLFCPMLPLNPRPSIHTRKSCFLCQLGLPIPAARQKDYPHLAFAHPGLVTIRSPSQPLPLPWPRRFGRCEILIASLGTGLFLSVVSDQNIILSRRYNYRGWGGGRQGREGERVGEGCGEGLRLFFLIISRLSVN